MDFRRETQQEGHEMSGLGISLYAAPNNDTCVPRRPAKVGSNDDPRNVYDVGNGRQFRPRWFVTLGA
jgi:hypothetical protein